MKKLFLASYFTKVAGLLTEFVGEDLSGKTAVFIPTAALHEEDAFYVDTDRAALLNLGLLVEELEISTAPIETIKKSLSNADCIFIGGGNTFFLLQELRRTGADKLVIQHINNGKPYIATSAGSCVLSKNVIADGIESLDVAPELNGDFSALSVVDFYIYPHYGHNYWEELDDVLVSKYYDGLDLIRISDEQVVTINGEDVKVMTV